jgi:AsmA protein
MDKRWFFIGIVVVGLSLVGVFIVPFVLNADSFRPAVETRLSAALGREVTMGKLSLSLMQGSLVAEDFVIADDPAFSSVPFVQAKSIAVGIELLPLLWHRDVRVKKLTLDTPSMQLIEHANGKWNYSSLGRSSSGDSGQKGSVSNLSIGELRIVNGSALVSSVPATAKPADYTEVNLQVRGLSLVSSCPFELSARLPGGGTLKLTGNAGPISQEDTSQTPFQATLQVREFNPVTSGFIDRSKGIQMETDVDGEIKSDGTNLTSSGKIKASRLQLAQKGSPAQEPVEVDYAVTENSATREGKVSDVVIHAGSAQIHAKGSFRFSPQALILDLHLSAPALPMEQVERLLPVVGIRMPTGSSLQGGTFTAEIAIAGAATSANVEGPIEIANTKLAGFDLGSNIGGLARLPGTASGTEIRLLKAEVNSSAQGTRLSEIVGDLPQIGTATGNGLVTPSGELDFHLTAKLNGGVAGKPSQPAGRVVPLTITGTATSPSIEASGFAMRR